MYNNENMNSTMSYGKVRIMHAVPDAPNVDVYANNMLIARNLAYGQITDYLMVTPNIYNIDIYVSGTMNNAVLSSMLTIEEDDFVTAVAAGTLNQISLLSIPDADVNSVPNKALIRFIHLSPNAPAVDITLPDGTILFRNVSYQHMTSYLPVDEMVYTLQVRVAGTNTIVLTVPGVDVREGNYYTIYAIGLVGSQPGLQAILVEDGVSSV